MCSPILAHVWGNRTVEQPLTILWMMNKLYPKLMPEATLKEEIRKFYATFFLYDMSDAQRDRRSSTESDSGKSQLGGRSGPPPCL